MKGEFDSPSHPTTSEYRDGWDALYRLENHPMHERGGQNIRVANILVYPNGCPILDDTKAS